MDWPGWEQFSAAILSCPGPLRRHSAALLPMRDVALPQVLLGSDSQLLAFAAATEGLGGRLFFAPLPEMFPDARSLRAAWQNAGGQSLASAPARLMHLRFGSVRAARVLKGVSNACVVAEAGGAAPLTASHHPFASGLVLPAAIRRVFVYGAAAQRPRNIGGGAIPITRLPPEFMTADLPATLPDHRASAPEAEWGLDIVSLAEFRSFAWAAGPVRSRTGRLMTELGQAAVLLPWNMDHPGSIVPQLLERLARLHEPGQAEPSPMPRVIVLPFNYVGQTGIIRRLIAQLREAAHAPEALLTSIFLARTATLDAVAMLRRIAGIAWVDGNDPEHGWSLVRLRACGIDTILIDPAGPSSPGHAGRLFADEAIWVEAETRCGALTFPARVPSLRALPGLLALTAARSGPTPAPRFRTRRARAETAAYPAS